MLKLIHHIVLQAAKRDSYCLFEVGDKDNLWFPRLYNSEEFSLKKPGACVFGTVAMQLIQSYRHTVKIVTHPGLQQPPEIRAD